MFGSSVNPAGLMMAPQRSQDIDRAVVAPKRVSTPPPPTLAHRAPAPFYYGGSDDMAMASGALTPRRTADSMMQPAFPDMEEPQKSFHPASWEDSMSVNLDELQRSFHPAAWEDRRRSFSAASSTTVSEIEAAAGGLSERQSSGLSPAALHFVDGVVPPPPPPVASRSDCRDLQKSLSKALSQTRRQVTPNELLDDEASSPRPRPPLPEELPLPAVSGNATAGSPPSLGSVGHPENCAGPCRYVKRQGGCRDGANCPQCHLCFWHRRSVMARQLLRLGITAEQEPALEGISLMPNTCAGATCGDSSVKVRPESMGTVGHPHSCGEPCKYVRRRTGCRDGQACPKCHACQWRRKPAGSLDMLSDEEDQADEGPNDAPATQPSAPTWLDRNAIEKLQETIPAPPGLTREAYDSPVPTLTVNVADCPSLGSLGHPWNCKAACKYVGRAGGCKDGWQCTCCHLCHWQRKPVAPAGNSDEASIETSKGSIGHPHNCSSPCKYVRRKGGCRDGVNCPHCHVCRWSRKHRPDQEDDEQPEAEGEFEMESRVEN